LANLGTPLVGLSSLAIGTDQLFAERVLAAGGELYVVIPHASYEATFQTAADHKVYKRLLDRATHKETLVGSGARGDAYLLAGHRIADLAEVIVAVWDGRPAAGRGGTADAVAYAVAHQRRVLHINPFAHSVVEMQ
jgi:hypothetical protein